MGKRSIFLALIASALVQFQAKSQEFTPEKMWSLNRISGTLGSSNEEWMVYQSSKTDYTANKGKTTTFLVELKTGKTSALAIDGAWNFLWNDENQLVFRWLKARPTSCFAGRLYLPGKSFHVCRQQRNHYQ